MDLCWNAIPLTGLSDRVSLVPLPGLAKRASSPQPMIYISERLCFAFTSAFPHHLQACHIIQTPHCVRASEAIPIFVFFPALRLGSGSSVSAHQGVRERPFTY